MMIRYLIIIGLLLGISCRKEKWNDRNKPATTQNLLQTIQANTNLSQFYTYLVNTGYDQVLASSKTFTVWAPVNSAWTAVDAALLNDTARLRLLIANHISTLSYTGSADEQRIATLNGKKIAFTAGSVEGIKVSEADQYTANGVLQVIDAVIIPKQNAWEYLNSTSYQQKTFLQSLAYIGIDTATAEQIGVNPSTGAPIYKPGTGEVALNHFLERVNINSEDSLLTYVILADDVYKHEQQRLTKYFTDSTEAVTDTTTQWNVIKDLVFNGVYDKDHLPATLYSIRDSVQFHINASDIISSQKVSNGIVYIVNHIDYELSTKIKPVIIEGEYYSGVKDATKTIAIRTRVNPNTGNTFRDVYMYNYGVASYWLNYKARLNSVAYQVYWISVNDVQTGTYPMRVAFDDPGVTTIPYTMVPVLNYNEQYVGDYTNVRYGLHNVYLVGNSVTTNGSNTILLDYIKLVPILN
ncbi:fasciclin domain-containing protein [Chitinophaga sancti]|uniref:fasciclin domain-containing protein n=1 Tax=Chitinophaga sancti TaxID=1004 RepID=UPI002A756B33|nr:fasciclin domain-containing protein [Chitinophaga sancti]WPQ65149.1 fasciclin domain-containing protein [Chitinophaga sancti]